MTGVNLSAAVSDSVRIKKDGLYLSISPITAAHQGRYACLVKDTNMDIVRTYNITVIGEKHAVLCVFSLFMCFAKCDTLCESATSMWCNKTLVCVFLQPLSSMILMLPKAPPFSCPAISLIPAKSWPMHGGTKRQALARRHCYISVKSPWMNWNECSKFTLWTRTSQSNSQMCLWTILELTDVNHLRGKSWALYELQLKVN